MHGCGLTEFVLSSFCRALGYQGTLSPFRKYQGLRVADALAQAWGKVWVWNRACYGEASREILADLCRSLRPGVKTPEL